MGTVFTVDARFEQRTYAEVKGVVRNACLLLHQIDSVFSTWRADSPIAKLRLNAIALDDLPDDARDVLRACRYARKISGGWFDPWAAPGGVDPTGYVKGWAGQRVMELLRRAGADAALVNAAGDLVGFGGPAADRPWRVGVANPFSPQELLGTVSLSNQALAVSGTYERGAHIYRPTDGLPTSSGVKSALVLGPELGLADALATGLVAGGEEALHHVSQVAGYAAMLILDDGQTKGCDSDLARAMSALV